MPTLLSVNSYHYRRDGSGTVYLAHNDLFEKKGWRIVPFAMQHPENVPSDWSSHFVKEVEFGASYSLPEKLVRAPKAIYSLEAKRKLSRVLAIVRPDIAHCHTIYHHLSPSILRLLRRRGIPTVMTLHDLKLGCPAYLMYANGSVCERCKDGRLRHVLVHRCVKRSLPLSMLVMLEAGLHRLLRTYADCVDTFVSPSAFYLEKLVSWGWPRERFVHIPNFVDVRQFEPEFTPGRWFTYVGRLAPEKGLLRLVRAAAQARVGLRLVGVGPQLAELRDEAERLGADITFVGRLTGASLHSELRGARATVLASEWYENAPMGILESYALGKPVIATNIGGVPEMLEPGRTGWSVEAGSTEQLANALRSAADTPDGEIGDMGRRARLLVEARFSSELYAERIARLYAGLSSTVH